MPYSVVTNSLFMPSQTSGLTLPWQIGLFNTETGADSEGCYDGYNTTHPKVVGLQWQAQEDTEIKTVFAGKLFICAAFQGGDGSTAYAIDMRTYHFASFLLTYSPIYSAIQEDSWNTASGFTIQPESELVALHPLIPEPADVSTLALPSGGYGREYAECYFKGNFVGPCAAFVTATSWRSPRRSRGRINITTPWC